MLRRTLSVEAKVMTMFDMICSSFSRSVSSETWELHLRIIFHALPDTFSTFLSSVIQEPIYTADQIHNYLCVVIYQPLTDALYEMTKAKPDDPLLWLAKFMLEHNNNKPVIREKSPQIMQHVMKIKETEAFERKQKHDDDDEGPAKCGCYLTKPSHLTTPSSSTCCNKIHWKISTR